MTDREIVGQKLSRARFIAGQLATVPFVRLLALTNSVALGTATELSDLDFFVVTAPNRLWTARFLLLLRAKWLGLTKRPGKTADQADFGWWVDETTLDLSPIALRNEPTRITFRGCDQSHPRNVMPRRAAFIDDPLLSKLVATFIPLVDRGGVNEQLIRSNQLLVNSEQGTVNSNNQPTVHERVISNAERDPVVTTSPSGFLALLEMTLGSWVGQPIEWLLFVLQRWKVWADPMAQRSNRLVVNDRRVDVVTTRHMLKLHHLDQRAKYRSRNTQ